MKVAYIFPGQGLEPQIGLWDKLAWSPAAQKVFAKADKVLGYSFSGLVKDGPVEDLAKSSKIQLYTGVYSIAALAAAKEMYGEFFAEDPDAATGHSLGKYAASAAARKVRLEDVIYLVRRRGEIMEKFGGVGGMAVVMGYRDPQVIEELHRRSNAVPVNFNSSKQTVFSGSQEEIKLVIAEAPKVGARATAIAVPLAAHHPKLMAVASDKFDEKELSNIEFMDSEVPFVINGEEPRFSKLGSEIQQSLREQIRKPVYWQKEVELMINSGIRNFLEFGPEPVLTRLLRWINKEVRGYWIGDYESAIGLKEFLLSSKA
ncbi:hypothetical protein A3J16_05775 [Candidatus Daviesbacteria bacterium RIFCSPLOWO2_02_FULL_39_13]|nr:MAG: hypothetical protein A3J16_05775 [Candidatus Daviesbacteria bacterium RIFCSPLOWO2_02_FULL_39_13]